MTDDNTQPPAETLAEAREEIARVLFDQRQTAHDFDDAADADPESDAGTLYSIVHDDANAVIAALTRRAGGADAEREALAGYRAAVSFIAADSWDGCSDCVETLKAAWAADWHNDQAADPDETARQLARIRAHRPPVEPRARGDAIPAGEAHGKWHVMLLTLVNALHRDGGAKTQAIGIDLAYQQALAIAATPKPTAVGDAGEGLTPRAALHAEIRAIVDQALDNSASLYPSGRDTVTDAGGHAGAVEDAVSAVLERWDAHSGDVDERNRLIARLRASFSAEGK